MVLIVKNPENEFSSASKISVERVLSIQKIFFKSMQIFEEMCAVSESALINRIRSNSRARGLEGISCVSLNATGDSLGHPSFESVFNQCFIKR